MLEYQFYQCSRIVKNYLQYFDLTVLRCTQVNYGVSILKVPDIDFMLLIMIVTIFCIIFRGGPVLVFLKLNATSIYILPYFAQKYILFYSTLP